MSTSESVERSARAEALRMLARRPLTVRELSERLARRGHGSDDVEAAIEWLAAEGYVDDASLSYDYLVLRAPRRGHGPERLVRELVARGVEEDVARAALRRALESGDLDPDALLEGALHKRLAGRQGLDPPAWRRVYNALLRAGFAAEDVRAKLAPHRRPDAGAIDGSDDDLE